jgi:hypothetical protein
MRILVLARRAWVCLGFLLLFSLFLLLLLLIVTRFFVFDHFTIATTIIVLSTTLVHEQHTQHARLHSHRRPPGPCCRPERLRLQHQLSTSSRLDRSLSCRLCRRRRQLPGRLRQRARPERVSDRRDQPVLEERVHPGRLWPRGHQEIRRVPCVLRPGLLLH